jgi:zinc resistance-associated protein
MSNTSNTTLKTIAAATIALTVAGAGLALAQQTPSRDTARWQPSNEDIAAFTDARIAGLKAGLKLTAEQEKNWPAVETAIRDLAKQRTENMKQRAERRDARRDARSGGDAARQSDTIARLRRGADALTTRAAGLKKLADASEPLYQSLDESQKHRFGMMLRIGGRVGGHHMGGRAGGGHWHRQHRADNAR